MKKLIASLCVVASFAAVAETVTSDTVFGVLKVTSDTKQTIISVPWCAAGSDSTNPSAVKVKDLVKTSNLTGSDTPADADQLLLYKDGAYKGWYLSSSKVWTGYIVAGATVQGSDDDTIARGNSLIVVRNDTTQPIYLYGQYTNMETGSTTLAMPTTTGSVALNLIAAPVTDAWNPNNTDVVEWTNPASGDQIWIPNTANAGQFDIVSYDTSSSRWVKKVFDAETFSIKTSTDISINGGSGVWLRSTATSTDRGGDLKVNWKK